MAKKDAKKDQTEGGAVATEKDNEKLAHSQSGGTTRDDALDAGVPMLQGDPSEPQGPEDAFGDGPKRGDYSDRVVSGPSMRSVPVEGGGQPVTRKDDDGNDVIVDRTPTARLEPQAPKAAQQGEVAGEKGGVTTS